MYSLNSFNTQVKTLVRTEQDADVALKLSSALTQALLMYRLQNVGNVRSQIFLSMSSYFTIPLYGWMDTSFNS